MSPIDSPSSPSPPPGENRPTATSAQTDNRGEVKSVGSIAGMDSVDGLAEDLEKRLTLADIREKEAARDFLQSSRPIITAKHKLPWDGFWSSIAQRIDGALWRWFGGDVEVARAREISNALPHPSGKRSSPAGKTSKKTHEPQASPVAEQEDHN